MTTGSPVPVESLAAVLVVEDDPAVRRIMARTLEAYGFRVLLAENARRGIEVFLAQQEDIALVVTDVMMPEVKGPEMVSILRQHRPELPVLYVSGFVDVEQMRAMKANEAPLIHKPFVPSALVEKVRELFPGRVQLSRR